MNVIARYLDQSGEKPASLAAKVRCAPSTITRLLKGERHAGPELARSIEAATNGEVKAIDVLGMALNAPEKAFPDAPESKDAEE